MVKSFPWYREYKIKVIQINLLEKEEEGTALLH